MTTSVNYHRIASDCYSSNTCNVGSSLPSCRADADGVGVASNTSVADSDIEIARGKAGTGEYAQCDIVAAACVVIERKSTVGCVLDAGCVVLERSGSRGCVVVGGRVVPERKSAVGRVLPARRIILERPKTDGCVVGGSCVAIECKSTVGCVIAARCVAIKRITTDGRVEVAARCKAEERIVARSSVAGRIASAGCRKNRSSCWR